MGVKMIWITTLVALLLSVCIFGITKKSSIHRSGKKLRREPIRPPDTLPILGNAIHFLKPRHDLFDWFVKCQQIFGYETFEISVPSLPPGVVINSPENLEFVLKNEASITKGEFFRERSWDLFGYGIINATGNLWRAQRKAGLKFFSGANLDMMIEDVLPEVYAETTRKQLLQAARDGSVIDLQKVFLDLTTMVVGHMAYDMEIDGNSPFSKAFDHASSQTGLRFQNPLYNLTELFNGASFRASLVEVKRFGRQIVSNAQKRRSRAAFDSLITNDDDDDEHSSSTGSGTLIDSLIEALGKPAVVADAALNFLSAGRDTTAQSFTWTFYALMRHPDSLARVRAEIDAIKSHAAESPDDQTADDPGSLSVVNRNLDISSLQPTALPYTTAVFYESLRLYPPVPFEIKQCSHRITLPDGTSLPAGAVVVWCIYAFNRAHTTFGDDAHLFRPERWLDVAGKFVGKSVGEFPVFNGGPRACLGKKMAEMMGCWVLVRMLTEWEFQEIVVEGEGVKGERVSANSLTLPMEGGLPCRVRLRERKGEMAK